MWPCRAEYFIYGYDREHNVVNVHLITHRNHIYMPYRKFLMEGIHTNLIVYLLLLLNPLPLIIFIDKF